MAWPPPVLPINRTDALTQQANHPADHNAANQAINDLVARVQANETDAAARRGFNAFTSAEITVAAYPTYSNVLSFGLPSQYKAGVYNLWFTGQVWVTQDYDVRLLINSSIVSATRISSFGNYSPLAVMAAANVNANDVIVVQIAGLSGIGGLRVGANLNGQRT